MFITTISRISPSLFKPLLEDGSIKKIGQNIKFDFIVLFTIFIDIYVHMKGTIHEHVILTDPSLKKLRFSLGS